MAEEVGEARGQLAMRAPSSLSSTAAATARSWAEASTAASWSGSARTPSAAPVPSSSPSSRNAVTASPGIRGSGDQSERDGSASPDCTTPTATAATASRSLADGLGTALADLADCDLRIALTHFSPVPDTLAGEPPEIYPFLGSYLLAEAIDGGRADLAVHGHAHAGTEHGLTAGGGPRPQRGAAGRPARLRPVRAAPERAAPGRYGRVLRLFGFRVRSTPGQ